MVFNFKYNSLFFICLIFKIQSVAQISNQFSENGSKIINPYICQHKSFIIELSLQKQKTNIYSFENEFEILKPSFQIRYGALKKIEFRLYFENQKITYSSNSIGYSGIHNLQFGTKINLLNENNFLPKISLLFNYNSNKSSTLFKGRDSIDGFKSLFAFENKITEKFLINYNFGVSKSHFNSKNTTLNMGICTQFYFKNDLLFFLEFQSNFWKRYPPINTVNAGLNYFINNELKIDLLLGIGLNKSAPKYVISLGGSIFLKNKNYE